MTNPADVFPILALKIAVVVLGLASMALECLGPEHSMPSGHENPIMTANIYSRWTFGWMTPLMKKGASEYITENDLPPLLPTDESTKLANSLKMTLDRRCVNPFFHIGVALTRTSSELKGKVHLWKALFSAYGSPYLLAACLKIVQDCLAFLQPQLLRLLLAYISAYQSTRYRPTLGGPSGPSPLQGFAIAGLMFVAAVLQTFILHQVGGQ